MAKNIGVAEVKRSFSAVMGEVLLKGEHFVIEKKGKPIVALVSVQELQRIEAEGGAVKKRGLLAAIEAWDDFEKLEETVAEIYEQRAQSKNRKAEKLG
jgi:antitoxin (DNA-binding transcriptional repressor) of toxin-antitoxin stability system